MLKDIQTLGCASKVYVEGLALGYNVETHAAYSLRPCPDCLGAIGLCSSQTLVDTSLLSATRTDKHEALMGLCD